MLLSLLLAAAPFDLPRAEANYQTLLTGQATLATLSPLEVAEVAELDRAIRADDRPLLPARERCRLQNWPKDGSPTPLEVEVIDLKCSQR